MVSGLSLGKQLKNSKDLIALVIGYGSIGRRHVEILSKHEKVSEVFVLSSQQDLKVNRLNNIEEALEINPDYFVISSPTSQHINYINSLNNLFSNKLILVEKPLFTKSETFSSDSNTFFVGYNLRFHPVLLELKRLIEDKEIINVNIFCNSFLPSWRKNIAYNKSSSAKKSLGGGVLLDLSHEIDYMINIFGNVEVLFKFNSKVSNLDIETDDYLSMFGKLKEKEAYISLELSYFSNFERREVLVNCSDISIKADLLKNKITFSEGEETSFDNFDISSTYIQQHDALLGEDYTNLCSLEEGQQVMRLIDQIRAK